MAFIPNSLSYRLNADDAQPDLCTVDDFSIPVCACVYEPGTGAHTQWGGAHGLLSVSQFIYSLGPSIVNLFFPILAGLFAGGMTGFTAYRTLFPIFSVFGIILSLWTFKGTEENCCPQKLCGESPLCGWNL